MNNKYFKHTDLQYLNATDESLAWRKNEQGRHSNGSRIVLIRWVGCSLEKGFCKTMEPRSRVILMNWSNFKKYSARIDEESLSYDVRILELIVMTNQ